jgi:1,4-dihydroxy-2-naphthoyl-CoA hydrolase
MPIWHGEVDLEFIRERGKGTMIEHVGIELIEAGEDFLKGRMPVDHRTRQPAGLLHGGASVVLAETLASLGAICCVDRERHTCVGQEINANHVRSARDGWVYGVAKPHYIGRSSHVWEVRITDEKDKLVCISRVTMAVIAKPAK